MSSSIDPVVLSPAQLKGTLYPNQGTDLFRQNWLLTLARHEADTNGDQTVSAKEAEAFDKTYNTDGKYGFSSEEAMAMITAFEKKSNAKYGLSGSSPDENLTNKNAQLINDAKTDLNQLSAQQVASPATTKPYDIKAARTMMAQHYPDFELMNMSGEEQINPQRVALYWNDDKARGDPSDATPDGGHDHVRQVTNRYRYGVSEVGDEKGHPLYIRVPNDTPPEKIEALLDDLRSLKAYDQAFPEGAHSRFLSLTVEGHGLSGGTLVDGDGFNSQQGLGQDGYDLLPHVQGSGYYVTEAPMELDRHTSQLHVRACETLQDLTEADIPALKAQVARNGAALLLNSTLNGLQWGIDPKTGKRFGALDLLTDPSGQTGIAALGENAGPGGNAFLIVPAGFELPDGSKASEPTIIRYVQKGDKITWREATDNEARTNVIFEAWRYDGGHFIYATNSPSHTVRYTKEEKKRYREGTKKYGQ
jgi:hypothetical protein